MIKTIQSIVCLYKKVHILVYSGLYVPPLLTLQLLCSWEGVDISKSLTSEAAKLCRSTKFSSFWSYITTGGLAGHTYILYLHNEYTRPKRQVLLPFVHVGGICWHTTEGEMFLRPLSFNLVIFHRLNIYTSCIHNVYICTCITLCTWYIHKYIVQLHNVHAPKD